MDYEKTRIIFEKSSVCLYSISKSISSNKNCFDEWNEIIWKGNYMFKKN